MSIESPQIEMRRSVRSSSAGDIPSLSSAPARRTAFLSLLAGLNNRGIVAALALVVAGAALATALLSGGRVERIAVVRSGELLTRFAGTREAHSALQRLQQRWSTQLDSLGRALDSARTETTRRGIKPGDPGAAALLNLERSIRSRQAGIERQAAAEEQQMTDGLVNKVNAFIADYARSHNIALVLGTTDNGSLLHAETALDITEPLIEALNAHHAHSKADR